MWILALVAMVVVVGCGGSDNNDSASTPSTAGAGTGASTTAVELPDKIIIAANGGSYDECQKQSFVGAWSKETGVEVEYGSPSYDAGVWKVQQESGKVEWDIGLVDSTVFDILVENDYLDTLVEAPAAIDLPDLVRDDVGIASEIFSEVVAYRADKFGDTPPQTWADVFDTKKFPGKRMFHRVASDFGILEMALMADGVAPADLYPLDVDRALAKLDTIKKDIVWYDSGTKMVAVLQQGEAVIGAGWDGRIKVLQKEEGADKVGLSFEQAIVRPDYWVIPKGAKNPDAAREFLKFALQPEQQAAFAACGGYPPPFTEAFKLLPEGEKFAVTPETTGDVVIWDSAYWKENRDAVNEKFNAWLGAS